MKLRLHNSIAVLLASRLTIAAFVVLALGAFAVSLGGTTVSADGPHDRGTPGPQRTFQPRPTATATAIPLVSTTTLCEGPDGYNGYNPYGGFSPFANNFNGYNPNLVNYGFGSPYGIGNAGFVNGYFYGWTQPMLVTRKVPSGEIVSAIPNTTICAALSPVVAALLPATTATPAPAPSPTIIYVPAPAPAAAAAIAPTFSGTIRAPNTGDGGLLAQ